MSALKRRWLVIPFATIAALAAVFVASSATAKTSASTIKIAVLSDCQGAFGSFDNQDLAGVVAAMSEYAGAKPVDPNNPRKGWTGGSIGGHPLEVGGVGRSNHPAATPDKGTKSLREQRGPPARMRP